MSSAPSRVECTVPTCRRRGAGGGGWGVGGGQAGATAVERRNALRSSCFSAWLPSMHSTVS